MKEDVILAVKDLSVIYQTDLETVYAVNGVSFTLGRGESLGLVGETGAGKTMRTPRQSSFRDIWTWCV